MSKVKFIYIGKSLCKPPKESFYALKLSKKDKEKLHPTWNDEQIKNNVILYPQIDDGDEVFVYGLGYKKFGKTNKVEVPLFSGEIEDWDEYLKTWGKECLFYSISGYSLYSMDCCLCSSQNEFYSILECDGGIEKYQRYVENIECIQEIQKDVINEKFSYCPDWERNHLVDDLLFRPSYSIMGLLPISPYLDTIKDDEKLEKFYRKYRHHEIMLNHADYDRYDELYKLIGDKDGYAKYIDEYYEVKSKILHDIVDILDKEINDGVFPIQMYERVRFIYGDRCEALYNYILNHFK